MYGMNNMVSTYVQQQRYGANVRHGQHGEDVQHQRHGANVRHGQHGEDVQLQRHRANVRHRHHDEDVRQQQQIVVKYNTFYHTRTEISSFLLFTFATYLLSNKPSCTSKNNRNRIS
jgi:hypothetical protein